MPRYLTFDEKTATALRRQIPEEQVFEHGASGAVEYALGSDKTLVTVIPTGAEREAAIAVFRRPKQVVKPAPKVEERKPVASVQALTRDIAVRAGGFLGLRDEAVFEEEEPPAPKRQSWWRKLWPEDE
jgi:hypothetical protein